MHTCHAKCIDTCRDCCFVVSTDTGSTAVLVYRVLVELICVFRVVSGAHSSIARIELSASLAMVVRSLQKGLLLSGYYCTALAVHCTAYILKTQH